MINNIPFISKEIGNMIILIGRILEKSILSMGIFYIIYFVER